MAAPAVAASRLMLQELGFISLMALTAEGTGRFAPWNKRRRAGPSANPFRPQAGAPCARRREPFCRTPTPVLRRCIRVTSRLAKALAGGGGERPDCGFASARKPLSVAPPAPRI